MAGRRRRERQQALWVVLSILIVVSMLCSLVLLLQPAPAPPPPTLPRATWTLPGAEGPPTPSPAATAEAPTPTAQGSTATPAASAADDFSFAVAGDSRDGDAVFREIVRRLEEERPAFLVHTGDLVSHGTEAEYQAFRGLIAGLTVPFCPVPGNHDAASAGLREYLLYSGAPAAHYSFDRGQAHLAFADSHSGTVGPDEMAWLDADLAATQQPLKIVVLHHPPFDPNGSDHVMTGGNEAFMELMRRRGVRYVFAGHIHAYAAEERDGVTYVISGGAGAPLYADEAHGGYHHYLMVRVRGAELSYEVVRVEPPASLAAPGVGRQVVGGRAPVTAGAA